MRFFIALFLFFFSLSFHSGAQRLPEVEAMNRVILNHKDSIIYAHLLPMDESNDIKVHDEYIYYWYGAHDIKVTRGGFDGKVLDGIYTEFYQGKDLKTKGVFRMGVKTGLWKTWYRNGELSQIMHYKHGLRHGSYTLFDEHGNVSGLGKYKHDKLHGKQRFYTDSGKVVITTHDRGKLVVPKTKKVKKFKAKRAKIVKDTTAADSKKSLKLSKKLKDKTTDTPDDTKKNKRSKKEPKIRVRRSIKIVPQEIKPSA